MTAPTITRLKLPAVRHYVESTQWAIDKARGLAMLDVLSMHAQGGAMSSEKLAALRAQSNHARSTAKTTNKGGAVAVLPLYGPIAQRMDLMMDMCGGTSTERFADDFDAAMRDASVTTIVIDCDSPGGSVQGTPELAARIYNARGKGKKLIAVSNSCMASAAYWICSACDEVVASPSADTGSIGVFTVHVDESGMNDMLGLKYTLIKAGDHKAEGNPWEALDKDAERFIQGQIDDMYGMFVNAVAKHRGVKASKVLSDFGEGRCFNASQALACGMIDRVATLEDTLKALGVQNVGASGRPLRAMNASATRADDAPDMPTEPDEDDMCPDCGAAMNDDGSCSKCDYMVPDSSQKSDDDYDASNASLARADGAAALAASVPDNRPLEAQEQPVNDNGTTAPVGAEAAIKAERERVNAIRKLGAKWKVAEDKLDTMITDGLTVDQAATRILGDVEAKHQNSPTITVGADRAADRPFASVGEQLVAVVNAGRGRGVDARLKRVNAQAMQFLAGSPDGMNESVGSEGGFYIQSDLLAGVMEPVYQDDPFLSRAKRIPIGADKNGVKYNVVDETSRADGSRYGGISMQWADENDTPNASKPKLRRVELELKKLIGASYLTEELTQDAPAAQTLLVDAFQTELKFRLATAIWRGTGVGQPLGFLKSGAFVSQTIESGQTIANTAASIYLNVTKMLSHIPAALWDDVIWLYNPELLPYLMGATVGSSSIPVFVPYAGFTSQARIDRILGMPAFPSDQAEAVGTPGDLVAVCPSQYHIAEKGGPQIATSVHVKFLSGENTLRIMTRFDGQPMWVTTVTPYKGAAARTAFVGLATRS